MTNRNCGSCRHFLKIEGSSTGHCTNPLVVSHQGGLVMYREAEIGCRRGWKQDLWEPRLTADDAAQEQDERLADILDRSRADAWKDLPPSQHDEPADLLADTHGFNDDDLLDPRGTRDIREAIRRAREAKKRELQHLTRREPQDQPILSGEQRSGEDTVLDVRPAPLERTPEPIVPPVSSDEIRKRVDEMRRQRRVFEPLPPVHFSDDEERYTRPPEPTPRVSPVDLDQRAPGSTVAADADYEVAPRAGESFDQGPAERWGAAERAQQPEGERSAQEEERPDWQDAAGITAEPVDGWPEQAPWAQEEPAFEEWIEQRPKRRSWFGSLLHRHHAPEPQPIDPLEVWEPEERADIADEFEPWDAPAESIAAAPEPALITPAPGERAGEPMLPPLPYDADDELGEDYLLADARFGEGEDDEQAASTTQVPRICATCRYFRPDGTCGNSFAFTFRRRVNEEYLSCASSIGSWWLPSDRYWESVVDFAHHGQPTPLLDRFALKSEEQETDDEMHTP